MIPVTRRSRHGYHKSRFTQYRHSPDIKSRYFEEKIKDSSYCFIIPKEFNL